MTQSAAGLRALGFSDIMSDDDDDDGTGPCAFNNTCCVCRNMQNPHKIVN